MAGIILFHHALGLTGGIVALADRLRAAGHEVTTPDVYDGRTFDDLDDGVGHARELGFAEVQADAERQVADLPGEVVYVGYSLGAMPAQHLGQTRPGARGVILIDGAAPLGEFAEAWPEGLPLQMHMTDDPDWSDLEVGRQLQAAIPSAELYRYEGTGHLFADAGTDDHDEAATELMVERILALLREIG